MHPSDHFFLKALFLRGLSAGSGGKRPTTAQGCVDKELLVSTAFSAMDFSKAGAIERAGKTFHAHVHFRERGAQRDIRGPCRPDEETAQRDLDSMRAAASGIGREEGFAAVTVS